MPRLGFLIKFIIKFNLCVSESMRFHASSCSINLSPALFCVCWICAMFCIFESHKLQFQCEKGEKGGEREEGRKTIKFGSPFFSSFLELKAHTWRERTEESFYWFWKLLALKCNFRSNIITTSGFYHLIGKFIRFYCRKLDHINYVTWWYKLQLIVHSLEKSSWTSTTNLHTTQQQQHRFPNTNR